MKAAAMDTLKKDRNWKTERCIDNELGGSDMTCQVYLQNGRMCTPQKS